MRPEIVLAERVAQLRQAFDRSFAEALPDVSARAVDLLAIRVANGSYVLRLSETAGVYAKKQITPVPSSARELLGIAGFRGTILPVYDLRALLGYSPTALSAASHWLVVAKKLPVALAFDALEGHLRLSPDAIAFDPKASQNHVSEIARTPALLAVVRLASVLEAIQRAAGATIQKDP